MSETIFDTNTLTCTIEARERGFGWARMRKNLMATARRKGLGRVVIRTKNGNVLDDIALRGPRKRS